MQKQKLFEAHNITQLWVDRQAGGTRPNKGYSWEAGKLWAVDHSDFVHAEFFYLCKRNPLIK